MSREVEIHTGRIYTHTRRAFANGAEVVIHKGGTGSGKTFDTIIWLIRTAIMFPETIITVVSESRPHLEIGAIRILKSVLKSIALWRDEDYNISKSCWTAPTGSIIEFFSADRIDKALGARRDWLFGNEINSLKLDVWDELARRSKYVIGDFNPTAQFWLEAWIENYDNVQVLKSNYHDNPYLPEHEVKRIERRASRDANFKRIHIDCEYGVYEGLVFTEWQQIDTFPDNVPVRFGLDFGYSNDPTALVRVGETPEAIYVDEILYRTGMLNRDIVQAMASNGLRKSYDEVIADSAEPKSIDEIRLAGYNVKPAVKGADSIRAGIDKIKSKQLYVTKRSTNIIKELRNYSWIADKAGQPTNKPVDGYNHAIDAIRYAVETKVLENWSI